LNATELSRGIAERKLSPVEITGACLERIEEHNATLRAFVFIDEGGALEAARVAEAEIVRHGPRSTLHGIPIAYKDLCDVAGMPTTAGSRILEGNIAERDCAVAARLRAAGAIALGKLNTFEFATGGQERFGEARNPWNLAYATGGSSTGAAAALAGRLVPLAIGTDTGGSVRIPASFCGLVALRPTRGRIDKTGVIPLSPTFDEVGPMARMIADCALLFGAMTGCEGEAAETDLRGVRIGIPDLWAECDPEVERAVATASAVLQQLGATLVEIELPNARYGLPATLAISYNEAFAYHRKNLAMRRDDFTPMFAKKIVAAGAVRPEELAVAREQCERIATEFADALRSVDAIVTPATPSPAYRLGNQHLQSDNGVFTRAVTCAGVPALALPCGFTASGLPLGMQLVGRAMEEARLFAFGAAYERATDWHRVRAPLKRAAVGV